MEGPNVVALIYRRVDPYLYGAVHTVINSLDNQQTSYPFIISKQLQGREIVYGSVHYLINQIADLLSRFSEDRTHSPQVLTQSGVEIREIHRGDGKTLVEIVRHDGDESVTDRFLHQKEEQTRAKILLIALHLRILFEVFSGKPKKSINLYDYSDGCIGQIPLQDLANLLMHYRYFVVNGEYLMDLFSGEGQLPSERLVGTKVSVFEFLDAVSEVINRIRVKDFIGVLRSGLSRLSASSEAKEIIFLVQNIHSLANIVKKRIGDDKFSDIANFLLRDAAQRYLERMQMERPVRTQVAVRHIFSAPAFKLEDNLSRKELVIALTIDCTDEVLKVPYAEFFKLLNKAYGNDPLVPFSWQRRHQ